MVYTFWSKKAMVCRSLVWKHWASLTKFLFTVRVKVQICNNCCLQAQLLALESCIIMLIYLSTEPLWQNKCNSNLLGNVYNPHSKWLVIPFCWRQWMLLLLRTWGRSSRRGPSWSLRFRSSWGCYCVPTTCDTAIINSIINPSTQAWEF
jgi:hypothetical protein